MSVQFREIRSSRNASFKTAVVINDRDHLLRHLSALLELYFKLSEDQVTVTRYYPDLDSGQMRWLVQVKGIGPIGFTDSAI
jgi:hypothetical protein